MKQVPEGWERKNTVTVKDYATIKHGYAFKSEYFSKENQKYILLTPGNFHIDKKLYFGENTRYYNGPVDKEYILNNGDLLIVMTDLTQNMDILGNTVILKSNKPVLHNQRIGKILLNESIVNKYFICYLLNSDPVQRQIKRKATGTTVRHTSPRVILDIKHSLPPLPEQEKIAEILSTWDRAIETTEKLITNSEAQKKALMQQLLTGKKRLLDEKGERFSGKWEKVKLNTLCDIQTGKKDANEGSEMGLYPFFTCAVNHIYSDEYSFDCEAITIAGNGAIGTTHYYNGKFEAYQRTYVLNHFSNEINSFYLLQFINYFLHIDIQREQQRGAMPYIRVGLLQNFKVHLPTIQEQQKIAEVLSTADREIELLQEKREHLKAEKKALMQQLLTGKRRVKVA